MGAVVLAPELHLAAEPDCYGLPEHPAVVSLLRLEEMLAAEFLEQPPKAVALQVVDLLSDGP